MQEEVKKYSPRVSPEQRGCWNDDPKARSLIWQKMIQTITGLDLTTCPQCGKGNLIRFIAATATAPGSKVRPDRRHGPRPGTLPPAWEARNAKPEDWDSLPPILICPPQTSSHFSGLYRFCPPGRSSVSPSVTPPGWAQLIRPATYL